MSTPAFVPTPCEGCGGGGGAAGFDAEGAVLCDFDAQGNIVGTALVEAVYDQTTGIRTGTRIVHPVTGDPYVPLGTLRPCDTGDCGGPVQFCFTATSTGPVDHPGRLFDINLPLNPGFALESIGIDAVTSPQNLVWDVNDATGQAFADELETRLANLLPAAGSIVVTPPPSGQNCGTAAEPFQVHIECMRLDQAPPDVIRLNYNGGNDLIQNPAYLETPAYDRNSCPLGPLDIFQGYHIVRRQDNGGTISCTNVANRGWETNDQAGVVPVAGTFELWCPTAEAAEGVTPTPRGTPTQEINSNGNAGQGGTTIWQTFQVTAAGLFKVRVVHGGRDNGETHTIRLSTGDTDFSGIGDLINDVTTNVPKVTTNGGTPAAAWTTFSQDINLSPGTYTLSIKSDQPTGNLTRGGLFTDARAYVDRPSQFVDSVRDDETCVVTTTETVNTTTCEWWDPRCENGEIIGWVKVDDGTELTNAQFWAQVPAPSCCLPDSADGGSGSVSAGNLTNNYPVCAVVGGVPTTLERIVITDQSGGVIAQTFIGPGGAPVATPASFTIGTCTDQAFISDEVLCDDNGSFVRKYRQSINNGVGQVNGFNDFTLAGLPYAPVGTVRACGAGQTLGPVCYNVIPPDPFSHTGFLTLGADGDPVLYSATGDVVPDGGYVILICAEFTQQSHILCDAGNANQPFLRWYVDSPIVGEPGTQWDFELDGSTAYAVVGPVVSCSTSGAADTRDAETLILCDATPTRFLRTILYDGETGAVASVVNTTLDGVTPFAPVGAVGICTTPVATDFDFAIEQLCDNNGPFLRRFTFNSATGAVTTITNTNLAGGAYVPVGTVGSCEVCCPQVIGEGCTNVGSGRYTAIRNANGTISLIDSVSGAAVVPGDIIPCTTTLNAQHRLIGDADAAWTPGADVVGTLTSVTYTILSGTATVTDQSGTVATGLPAGLAVTWSAEDDNTLSAPQSIDAINGQTYVNWSQR